MQAFVRLYDLNGESGIEIWDECSIAYDIADVASRAAINPQRVAKRGQLELALFSRLDKGTVMRNHHEH